MRIPESCKQLEEHKRHVGDWNLRGQILQLQCQIDKTDFDKNEDIYDLKAKAVEVADNLTKISRRFPGRGWPERI